MRTISTERLTLELARRPGLIPVSVNLNRNQLNWCDVGNHRFTEPGFNDFLVSTTRQPTEQAVFATDLADLAHVPIPGDCIPPTGFIFHSGRCGSTLFSRALARSARHLVISEAQPHNEIWSPVTRDWKQPDTPGDQQLKLVENLIRMMGRQRNPETQRYFVKFSSFQVLFAQSICKLFPDVPAIFLYRDPVEVLTSLARNMPGWQTSKNKPFGAFCAGRESTECRTLQDLDFMAACLTNTMSAALAASGTLGLYLNYQDLKADKFSRILDKAFRYKPPVDVLEQMQSQFGVYSKDAAGTQAFRGDPDDKGGSRAFEIEAKADGRLAELYRQLEGRAWSP